MIADFNDAQRVAAEHMRRIGFDDAEITLTGRRSGVHIKSIEAVAQVRHFRDGQPVSKPYVRDVHRSANVADKLPIFYSLSGYSGPAIDYADNADVALFKFDPDGHVTPVNGQAEELAGDMQVAVPPPETVRPKRSRANASKSNLRWWVALAVIAALLIFTPLGGLIVRMAGLEPADPAVEPIHGEQSISRAGYEEAGKTWPFKVDEGVVRCRGDNVITFTADNITYPLEGLPESRIDDHDWYNVYDISADDEGFLAGKIDPIDVITDGRSLCPGEPAGTPPN